jgi:cell division protein FtsB
MTMTGKIQFGNGPNGNDELEVRKAAGDGAELDAALDQALTDFRSSIHAWSEAVYSQPRTVQVSVRHRTWRLAAGWALGCVLLAGGVSAGVVEHQRQAEAARVAAIAQQQARQQQLAAAMEQARQQDPGLLAKVDSDTSQEVPDAMEPLAQMMEDGGTQ